MQDPKPLSAAPGLPAAALWPSPAGAGMPATAPRPSSAGAKPSSASGPPAVAPRPSSAGAGPRPSSAKKGKKGKAPDRLSAILQRIVDEPPVLSSDDSLGMPSPQYGL